MTQYTLTRTETAPTNYITEAFKTALEEQDSQPIHYDTLIEQVLASASNEEGKTVGQKIGGDAPEKSPLISTNLNTVIRFFPELGKLIYGR